MIRCHTRRSRAVKCALKSTRDWQFYLCCQYSCHFEESPCNKKCLRMTATAIPTATTSSGGAAHQRRYNGIVEHIADNVGNTPMVRLRSLASRGQDLAAKTEPSFELVAKAEYLNPSGSVKDRVAEALLRGFERDGRLQRGGTLVVPTTGNLGLSLAVLAQGRGYKMVALVPERTSSDRIRLLRALRVDILRTPNDAHPDAAESHIALAKKIAEQIPNSVVIDEFSDAGIPDAFEDMAMEIFEQCEGKLDALVVGVENGGTVSGLAKYLKPLLPDIKVVGVEPCYSSISTLGGTVRNRTWKVEDIGSNFVSEVFDRRAVDKWIQIEDKDAYAMSRLLCTEEGLLCGPSSGAVVCAALRYAKENRLSADNRVVAVLSDSARNYQSTLLSDEWLVENDLADEFTLQQLRFSSVDKYRGASIEDLQLPAAVSVHQGAPIASALDIMVTNSFSQVPVVNDARGFVGFLSLANVQLRLDSGEASLDDAVARWMYTFRRGGKAGANNSAQARAANGAATKFHIITPDTPLSDLDQFFEHYPAAFVTDENRKFCLGVVTKYDLVSFLSRRPSACPRPNV